MLDAFLHSGNKPRLVQQQVAGHPARDGAGVNLIRVLGGATIRAFDPFLLLDAFDSNNPDDYIRGFPLHPHRGIETVTYLVEGLIKHKDSLGNQGDIVAGGCQWMTAGRGILHEEMPQASPRMFGLQLWVNLAAGDKMVVPKYRDIRPEQLPVVQEEGAELRILAGSYKGQPGAMRADYVPVTFLDVNLKSGAQWSLATKPEDTVFAYIFSGSCLAAAPPEGQGGDGSGGSMALNLRQAVLFSKGETLNLQGGQEDARMVLVMGKALQEPVAWGGPIVMNTDEELRQAFFELEAGTFIQR